MTNLNSETFVEYWQYVDKTVMVLAGIALIFFFHMIPCFGFTKEKKIVGNMLMHNSKQARGQLGLCLTTVKQRKELMIFLSHTAESLIFSNSVHQNMA